MKITKKDVQLMFDRLTRVMNKTMDIDQNNRLILDYASCYGGYVIKEVDSKGGCSNPFSSSRRSAKEMYLSMLMTCQALESIQYNKHKE